MMAREILFKAKRIDNGEWVEGGYYHKTDYYGMECEEYYIVDGKITDGEGYGEHYLVDANTICQYTGLTDKNGNKIWENDVVKTSVGNALVIYVTDAIYFNKYNTGFIIRFADDVSNRNYRHDLAYWIKFDSKNGVIGNIFDNPELLVATTGGAE